MAPFGSSTASREESTFKGTLSNGQRENSVIGDSDRSASVLEGNASQAFVSGANMLQGSSTSSADSDPSAQSSKLDPKATSQKYTVTSSGELRQVLGTSLGNSLEDCAFRTANLISRLPADSEKLKEFKVRMQEASGKSRYEKRLDESVHKLNKVWEAVKPKNQFQNELLPNETISGSHLSKMGSQTHRSPTEFANPRLKSRPKNVILNKCIRTSAIEIQAEGQNNSFGQPLAIGKNRENIEDGGKVCDGVEEKIQRLPTIEETRERKAKRKPSMCTGSAGSIDGEGKPKRAMYLKRANESGVQSCDAIGLRFVDHDKNYTGGIYLQTKGKASRAPRTGNLIVGNSSSLSHSSETLEALEQPSNVNEPHSVSGTINGKRTHLAQWVRQRPQKISRTRRANVVSPFLNCDEMQVPLEGCSPSEAGTRTNSTTTSGPPISKGAINNINCDRMKNVNNSSPTRLSQSEESGAGGLDVSKGDERVINNSCNISSYMSVTEKEKLNKVETGDGLRRQCRGSSDFSVLKSGISSTEEKLDTLTSTKPIRNMKPSSEKKARSRRSHNSKAIAHLGDIAGRSGDDREELLSAANFASNASYIGCSSSFWKKVEPNFAPVSLDVIVYLKQLVKTIEDDQRCLSQRLCLQSDAPEGVVLTDKLLLQSPLEGDRGRSILDQTESKEPPSMVDTVDQHRAGSFLCSQMNLENKPAPLYQRVLSALIVDDQTEETVGDENISFLCERDDSTLEAWDFENQFNNSRTEHGCNTDTVSCKGNATSEHTCMEDKLLLELQSVGIYPELVPDLADGGCEAIDQNIIQLQKECFQQLTKKRKYFMKLIQAVEEGREMEPRALEQVAMDKLVELAYKKKLATRGTSAAKYGLSKVSRPAALGFMKRTLARCRMFEETGKSCFQNPMFKDILFATLARENNAASTLAENLPLAHNSQQECALSGSFPCTEQNVLGNSDHPSDLDAAKIGPILNGGKKEEVLLDEVGASASLKPTSTLGNSFLGGAKGKRSGRVRNKDTSRRSSVQRGVRSSASNTRSECKIKPKAKPKAAQLSTSAEGSLGKLVENINSENQLACGSGQLVSDDNNRKSKVGSVSHGNDYAVETEEPMDLTDVPELDSTEVGVGKDLDSWLDIDVDAIQDDEVAVGLDIPMDDLSMVL
ncbi:hypothetical protein MtrunA17_Chr1g0210751 [Medicago truncatula]|uniref:Uncharacterized protein n=1 Tax=Medicago truncatula TaxID=3880 RepID=A0A072VQN9_MEDTR|nr:uncharacterized protein LOC25485584 isoform X2 [Medicago truncatula]KEH44319.1 hypothetical protein MTR_1g112190 [Medicago truncatula]RHN82521.1 hypothetical protein MtrunA17_Chr1g0210751 [Medicago truncatula]